MSQELHCFLMAHPKVKYTIFSSIIEASWPRNIITVMNIEDNDNT